MPLEIPQTQDFLLRANNGDISGVTALLVRGHNPDVDIATSPEDLSVLGTLTFPSSAESLEIVSASTNDDGAPPNTGARTCVVTTLDSAWALNTEEVTMDGTTAAALTGTHMRALHVYVKDVGSGGVNAGAITVRVASAGGDRCKMRADEGESHHGSYTIPANKTGYITRVDCGLHSSVTGTWTYELLTRIDGESWRVRHGYTRTATQGVLDKNQVTSWIQVPEKTDIRMRASAVKDDTGIAGEFELIIVDDT